MPKFKDIKGEKFGRLLVMNQVESVRFSPRITHRAYRVICDCGTEKVVTSGALLSGNTKSCGCLAAEKLLAANLTHGLTRRPDRTRKAFHPLYSTWETMRKRCNNPKCKSYPRYGGKGVKVCERWNDFEKFVADMGEKPPGTTLDRWPNGTGNYEPGNCRWANRFEQSNNRSSVWKIPYNGKLLSLKNLSEASGISARTLQDRRSRGVDLFATVHRIHKTPE